MVMIIYIIYVLVSYIYMAWGLLYHHDLGNLHLEKWWAKAFCLEKRNGEQMVK